MIGLARNAELNALAFFQDMLFREKRTLAGNAEPNSVWEAVIVLAFWRSGRFGVLAVLAGPPIWLPIWRRSGGGQSGAILAVLATAPFWRRSRSDG